MITVSNGEPTRKDTIMKLLLVITAILALTLAEQEKREVKGIENIADSQAEASNVELLNDGADLVQAASSYHAGHVDHHYGTQQQQQQQQTWVQPAKPAVQNDYYWVNTGGHQHHPTTPQVPVIKNEIYYGDNGDYKYEYKTADGTHVGEQGWFTDPKRSDESLVKKGWYSFVGADGITYTVTYWADHTGYHAYGNHLPSANSPYPTQTQTTYPAQTTTQRPIYPPKPIYTTPRPIYTVRPTYPINYPPQQQIYYPQPQPTYNQPQQPMYNQNYNV